MSEDSGMVLDQKQAEYDYLGDLTPAEWDEPLCKLLADAFLETLRNFPSLETKGAFPILLPDSMPASLIPYWEGRGFNITFRPATKRPEGSTFLAGVWAKKYLVQTLTPSIWASLEGEYTEVKP